MASEVSTYWKAMSSGGSTGRPKIIVDHMPGAADPDGERLLLPQDKCVLNPGPLYHNAPFTLTHSALFKGNSVVGMEKFDAERALALIAAHDVAWVNFVPTMMSRIYRLPEERRRAYDLSSLETVWHMAAPMPPWLKHAWIEWLGPERIWELYGGTERQGTTIIGGVDWLAHEGSVGRPINAAVRVLDEEGRPTPPGEIGEIFFMPETGAGSTYHYIGADSRVAAEGWESIGDFGWLDEDGFLYLADRRTDLILSGARNIYPAEIENALSAHPGVECAVAIGLPDDDLGAVVHAIVKPTQEWRARLNETELRTFLAERLVSYKIPRTFEFTDSELRDDAGKVRRSTLRAERIAATQAS